MHKNADITPDKCTKSEIFMKKLLKKHARYSKIKAIKRRLNERQIEEKQN
jgi:hypothetical protein